MDGLTNFENDLSVAVIGASGAIGHALVAALIAQPQVAQIYMLSRTAQTAPAEHCHVLPIDLTQENTIQQAANSIKQHTPLDIVLVATGILHNDADLMPEKSLRDLSAEKFQQVFAINTIGPALIAKHFLPIMHKQRKAVFAVLSARVGSISDNHLGGWYAYRASKAGLNMILKTAAIEIARTNKQVIVAGLHPGTVDSRLSQPFQANVPSEKLFTPQFAAEQLLQVIIDLHPQDTGKVFAWDGQVIPY
ncbi:MAG: SDR family NAD(P)-dependent oxidoreductase [Gammaproteobacteria bacterium]